VSRKQSDGSISDRPQFGLRSLFALVTFCAVFLSLWNLSGGELLAFGFSTLALWGSSFVPSGINWRRILRSWAAATAIAFVVFVELASGYSSQVAGIGTIPGPPSRNLQRLFLAVVLILAVSGLFCAYRCFRSGTILQRLACAAPGLLLLAVLGFILYGLVIE
jgi:hypothetical protein